MALLAYKVREASGFFNAIFAFDLESQSFPLDFFNEYSLTQNGRTSQGIIQFKNQMLALVDKSKKLNTKPGNIDQKAT